MTFPCRLPMLTMLLCVASVMPSSTVAAPFSANQVRIVVGFSAGGAVDVVARIIAARLSDKLGTSVIVDDKPGFSGNLGAQLVAKAAPDGATLLMAPVTSYAVTEAMMGSQATGFSLESDLVAIGAVGEVPLILAVHPSVPVNTLAEYIALAKTKPMAMNFASSGNGSTEHVVAEMFQQRAGVVMLHVPYKGGAPAINDLMGGQVQSMFATIPNVIQNVKAGRLKAIAITTAQRHPALPQVPTVAESGLPGFEVSSVYVLMAPAATPAPVLQRLNDDLVAALKEPETAQKIAALGITPTITSVAEARARTLSVVARWKEVVRASNMKPE